MQLSNASTCGQLLAALSAIHSNQPMGSVLRKLDIEGPVFPRLLRPDNGTRTAVAIVETPFSIVVLCDGCWTYTEAALLAGSIVEGTCLLRNDGISAYARLLIEDIVPTLKGLAQYGKKLILVGHSMGGVAAETLCYEFNGNSFDEVELLTAGTPRYAIRHAPRMPNLVFQSRVFFDDDLIAGLPPRPTEQLVLTGILDPWTKLAFQQMVHRTPGTRLLQGGQTRSQESPWETTNLLKQPIAFTDMVLALQDGAHKIYRYSQWFTNAGATPIPQFNALEKSEPIPLFTIPAQIDEVRTALVKATSSLNPQDRHTVIDRGENLVSGGSMSAFIGPVVKCRGGRQIVVTGTEWQAGAVGNVLASGNGKGNVMPLVRAFNKFLRACQTTGVKVDPDAIGTAFRDAINMMSVPGNGNSPLVTLM